MRRSTSKSAWERLRSWLEGQPLGRFATGRAPGPKSRRPALEILEGRIVPATFYDVQLLSPTGGVAGTGGSPIVAGGLEVFGAFDPEADGVAVVEATTGSEAVREAIVGTVTADLYNNGSSLADFNFYEDYVGFSPSDQKPFLVESLGGNLWRIRLENNLGFVGPTGGTYDDGSWDVSVTLDAGSSGNATPVAASNRAVTSINTPVSVSPLDNATDADGDYLTLVTAGTNGATAHGFAMLVSGGRSLTYNPSPGYSGTDTIPYTFTDGAGGTTSGSIGVVVYDKPVVTATTPDDDITPDITDPNASVAYTLHVIGSGLASSPVDYRITVFDGPGFTNIRSQ